MTPTPIAPEELLGKLNPTEEKNAPPVLYVAGDRSILQTGARVAIVGSRKASEAGLARARKLARHVVREGGVVVSGLAEGIDTAAHLAAIEAGGPTIAVIGTPLDQFYPPKNRELQERLMREHLVVSQFAPGARIWKSNFPQRNRTMALLADASVIIEASEKSGTISQGWEAHRLGRPLFLSNAVASDASLTWPAKLQKYGARVLSDDTLHLLFEVLPARVGEFQLAEF